MTTETPPALLIQFPHPGQEWGPGPDGRTREWTSEDDRHGRKYLVHTGRFLDEAGEVHHGEIGFWGEWEARSSVDEIAGGAWPGPRWTHRPLTGMTANLENPQNTDPFVFGMFIYALCRQPGSPTLRVVPRGSVILFGSTVARRFVLDTVFVVATTHPHARVDDVPISMVPAAYPDVSLRPWYRTEAPPCTLYVGATHDDPIDGMFSFVPCRPLPAGAQGFARPAITATEINPRSSRQFSVRARLSAEEMRPRWRAVLDDVRKVGCLPCVHVDEVEWGGGG